MIYVASLYSNGTGNLDPTRAQEVLDVRYNYTMKVVHEMLTDGKFPYSPIVHCHEMSNQYMLPKDYGFWKAVDRNAIGHCSSMVVLKMTDELGCWNKSVGMTDEIAYAKSLGKDIAYFNCNDYEGVNL
tara:strand:- start:144 stop:527 length:384 start_codon:yes stop_codon:yes gene_type:complete